MEKVPKMCITCQYYEPYYCTLDEAHIGYLYCQEPTKCRAYRLWDAYKKGGKFYEYRKKNLAIQGTMLEAELRIKPKVVPD